MDWRIKMKKKECTHTDAKWNESNHTHFDAAKWLRGGTDQNTRVKDRKDKQEHHSYRYYWQMVLNRYDKTVNTHAYSTHVIRLHNTMPSHTQAQAQTHTQTHTYHTYYEYLHLSRYGWRHWHKRWYGVAWQSAIISYTYHATLSHKNKNKSLCCVRVFFFFIPLF